MGTTSDPHHFNLRAQASIFSSQSPGPLSIFAPPPAPNPREVALVESHTKAQ